MNNTSLSQDNHLFNKELRSEDYTLGRKTGPTAGTTTATTSANTGGLFGSSTPGFSAFAQPKTGFGTTSKNRLMSLE